MGSPLKVYRLSWIFRNYLEHQIDKPGHHSPNTMNNSDFEGAYGETVFFESIRAIVRSGYEVRVLGIGEAVVDVGLTSIS